MQQDAELSVGCECRTDAERLRAALCVALEVVNANQRVQLPGMVPAGYVEGLLMQLEAVLCAATAEGERQ